MPTIQELLMAKKATKTKPKTKSVGKKTAPRIAKEKAKPSA